MRMQALPEVFQQVDDGHLRRIALVTMRAEAFLICLANSQDTGYPFLAQKMRPQMQFYNRAQ